MKVHWIKIAKNVHVSQDGCHKLIRRNVFGGKKWQVFCCGHPPNNEKCDKYAIVSCDSFGEAQVAFDRVAGSSGIEPD